MKKSCRSVYISFFGVYLYFFNICFSLSHENVNVRCVHGIRIFFFLFFPPHALSHTDDHSHAHSLAISLIDIHTPSHSFPFVLPVQTLFTCLREYLSVGRYIIIATQPFVRARLFKISSPCNRTCDVIPYLVIS